MGLITGSSGAPKYVFTQALAPSGEGEIEGSLWYNTTLNRLETYTGAAWTSVLTEVGINDCSDALKGLLFGL